MRKLNVYPAFVSALVLAAVCAVPLGAGGGVHAEEPRTALFLVDGSGSMWARFDTPTEKRAKIDVVRELLKPLISADKTSRIGLGSFGHRQRGDCSDVEIIAAPGADRDGVLGPLEKLNPKGKGPLAQGLRQSTAAIGASRPASIVVINDGTDNCRQDACAAAAEIAKTAPGIAIHVIAVGVDPGDHPHLQCITKATGGKFFDVRDPLGLAAAISEAGMLALGG
ncbi:MAG: VWA domain-containing protein, partial [Hyphomicrobium sp.]